MKAVAQSRPSLTIDLAIGLYFAATRDGSFWTAAAEAFDRWAESQAADGYGFSISRLCVSLHARQCRLRARRLELPR